ncbi:hypothetical protein B0H13DRAFT_2422676 [Mycena leptocephala]|nr:hypothetical protein B0H13DRAFT_2466521 [Mycena leptocephala]KAJ7836745.1 hypothetical protein B0H13DRAFT_2422676 [Mycena leptocephala]
MVVTAFNVTAVTVFLVFYNDPRRTLWITARNAAQESRFDSIETPFALRARPESDNPTIDVVVGIDCTHEKAYVDGLDLIYSHFLTPIIASLETSQPLLRRSDLASVFSNFVDIWNLRRAFYASLSDLFVIIERRPSPTLTRPAFALPVSLALQAVRDRLPLHPIFYGEPGVTRRQTTPILITARPSLRTCLRERQTPAAASSSSVIGSSPLCSVARATFYFSRASLNAYIDPEDLEHAQLTASHTLVSKITLTLNTSIHTHAQTLSLLALQRSTPSLPFQLIVPGRTLVRRGPLSHVERSAQPRPRVPPLLRLHRVARGRGRPAATATPLLRARARALLRHTPRHDTNAEQERGGTSPAQCEWGDHTRDARFGDAQRDAAAARAQVRLPHPMSRMKRSRHASSGTTEEGRWVCKGRVELVDLEVVVTPPREFGEERRFEVLSPEGSFVLYAGALGGGARRLDIGNIAGEGAALCALNATAHLRRSLQALPFPRSDERLTTLKEGKGKGKKLERRGRVEHWVPAIWIPDEKTEGSMRCGRPFGWRRRWHHCRLCGRCICSSCSDRTFFISDPNAPENSSKPARACNACSETVFPLLDNPPEDEDGHRASQLHARRAQYPHLTRQLPILALHAFASTTEALVAIDRGPQRYQSAAAKYERLRRGDISARSEFDLRLQGEEGSDMSHVEMTGERVCLQEDADEDSSGSGAQIQTGGRRGAADEVGRHGKVESALLATAVALQTCNSTLESWPQCHSKSTEISLANTLVLAVLNYRGWAQYRDCRRSVGWSDWARTPSRRRSSINFAEAETIGFGFSFGWVNI